MQSRAKDICIHVITGVLFCGDDVDGDDDAEQLPCLFFALCGDDDVDELRVYAEPRHVEDGDGPLVEDDEQP